MGFIRCIGSQHNHGFLYIFFVHKSSHIEHIRTVSNRGRRRGEREDKKAFEGESSTCFKKERIG